MIETDMSKAKKTPTLFYEAVETASKELGKTSKDKIGVWKSESHLPFIQKDFYMHTMDDVYGVTLIVQPQFMFPNIG